MPTLKLVPSILDKIPQGLSPTCEFLKEIGMFADSYADTLSEVAVTFKLMQEGFEVVYGLDFDVIYGYANPWSRDERASSSRIINYILEEDKTKLTILPGTLKEMGEYLGFTKKQKIIADEIMENLEASRDLSDNMRSAIKNLYDTSGDSLDFNEKLDIRGENMVEICKKMLEKTRTRLVYSEKKIEKLLYNPRMVDLPSIYSRGAPERYWDEDTARKIFVSLANPRPGKRQSNKVDAYNIATVIKHLRLEDEVLRTNPSACKKQYLRLLTNTNCIFQLDIPDYMYLIACEKNELSGIKSYFADVRSIMKDIRHSYAVRSCTEAAFALSIAKSYGFENADICYYTTLKERNSLKEVKSNIDWLDLIAALSKDQKAFFTVADILKAKKDSQLMNKVEDCEAIIRNVRDTCECFGRNEWLQNVKRLLVLNAQEVKNRLSGPDREKDGAREDPAIYETKQHMVKKADYEMYYLRSDLLNIGVQLTIPDGGYGDKMILEMHGISPRGGRGKGLWVLENTFPAIPVEIITLEFLEDAYSATWPSTLTEEQITDIINDLFIHGESKAVKDLDGEICAIFGDSRKTVKLFDLPLKYELTLENFRSTIDRCYNQAHRVHMADDAGASVIPAIITCNTRFFDIRFDNHLFDSDAGMIFGFSDKEALPVLFGLFEKTSEWARSWHFRRNLTNYIKNEFERTMDKQL